MPQGNGGSGLSRPSNPWAAIGVIAGHRHPGSPTRSNSRQWRYFANLTDTPFRLATGNAPLRAGAGAAAVLLPGFTVGPWRVTTAMGHRFLHGNQLTRGAAAHRQCQRKRHQTGNKHAHRQSIREPQSGNIAIPTERDWKPPGRRFYFPARSECGSVASIRDF